MLFYFDGRRLKYLLIIGLCLFLLFPGLFYFILQLSLFIVFVPIALGIIGFWVVLWQVQRKMKNMQAQSGSQKSAKRIMKDIN